MSDTSLYNLKIYILVSYLCLPSLNDPAILSYAIRSHPLHSGSRPRDSSLILGTWGDVTVVRSCRSPALWEPTMYGRFFSHVSPPSLSATERGVVLAFVSRIQ